MTCAGVIIGLMVKNRKRTMIRHRAPILSREILLEGTQGNTMVQVMGTITNERHPVQMIGILGAVIGLLLAGGHLSGIGLGKTAGVW